MARDGFPGKHKLRWKLQLRILIKVHSWDQSLGRGKKEADKGEQDIELHWGPDNSPGGPRSYNGPSELSQVG